MPKLVAIINVICWSGFWAFGYIALTTHAANGGQIVTASVIAFVALMIGLFAYLWLARHTEATGYAPKRNRAARFEEE
ncbi:MAG: hypothetical protein CSA72_11320 [Rhodobacterales bacterium]|nr:MAG: hypothetical protein CSA72_11320 [Rhodobacterales bacterium]